MRKFMVATLFVLRSMSSFAGCNVVDGDKTASFDGKSIDGLVVEKKSLLLLNKEFPMLNIVEKIFKGEAQTCTSCSDKKHIACSN